MAGDRGRGQVGHGLRVARALSGHAAGGVLLRHGGDRRRHRQAHQPLHPQHPQEVPHPQRECAGTCT